MSGTIGLIDEYISKCDDKIKAFDKYSSNGQDTSLLEKESEELIQDIISHFYDIENITNDLCCYRMPPQIDYSYDFRCLKSKLQRYKAKIEDEKEYKTSNTPMISISQNQTNIQSIRISIEQTVNAIEAIPEDKLSRSEKDKLLKELKKLESEKDKSKIWERAQSVLKWIADKSVDVAIAALPYILEVLKNN